MSHEKYPTEDPAIVTCGLPYANGDLHIGHLRTYVGGDVFTRGLETLGQETAFICGSDFHGTPIAVRSLEEGRDPEELAMGYHEQYQEVFPQFDIEFDNYGHTHEEINRELTYQIVQKLEEEGYIYEDEILVAWDPEEEQPLPDRYVEGTCPYCGEQARGDECDDGCGRHLEPGVIEDPVSNISGNPAEYRERTHKFFRVSELSEYLTAFLDRLEGTANARNQPRQWIEEGLEDWCVTRDLDWGFDYPGEDDLVLYVWVDAPIEYIASTKQYTDCVGADTYDWEEPWKDDGEIIHYIGRDIIQHHTVFWPAMLHVAKYNEPRAVVASGFMSLDGEAFSTSRNRAIWASEYLEEGFHPDLLRYYLTTVGGFQDDIDFSWERFRERVNGELVGNVGNFAYRSLLFAYDNWGGTPDADLSEEVETRIQKALDEFSVALNDYSTRRAAEVGIELASFGNQYIQKHEPWHLINEDEAEAAQVLRDCIQIVKAITILLSPTLSGKSEELWTQLGEDGSVREAELADALEAPPETFDEPSELFEKIEDERVEELNEKLQQRIAEVTGSDEDEGEERDESDKGVELEPITSDRISFDQFGELDLRVAEIRSAEPIEGADDLLKLSVDIGVEQRQLVAGIAQLHDVEDLPGTKIVVVANMEEVELFGVESNGMLLAAGEDADLLTTHGDCPPGTKIK